MEGLLVSSDGDARGTFALPVTPLPELNHASDAVLCLHQLERRVHVREPYFADGTNDDRGARDDR